VPDQINAAQEGQREAQPGAGLDLAGGQPALGGGALRAKATGGVGAAQEITDIIEQVGADLDEGGAKCGGKQRQPEQRAAVVPGDGGADEDRRQRDGERLRAAGEEPGGACLHAGLDG